MANIGQLNNLEISKIVESGAFLDGGKHGEIFVLKKYLAKNQNVGDVIEVFVYPNSEDKLEATLERPYAMVGDFAYLEVVSVNAIGAFVDWGLGKNILVPFSEQKMKMEEGRSYAVFIYVDDETNRIVATSKLNKFLNRIPITFKVGQEVDLMIYSISELGFNAVINNTHSGILYQNEVFQPIQKGEKLKGYVKKIREDGKIDLSIQKPGYAKTDDLSKLILDRLREHNGFIDVTDKSPSEFVYLMFGISKKAYKMAVGKLYKMQLINIERDGIRLMKK